jgi:hypothetical protein
MGKINNIWVQTHHKEISAIKRQLIEYNYSGAYGGSLPLMKVNNLLDGALIEITKLQNENNLLKATIEALKNENKEV